MFEAFITGSHAYGTPGPESDIDLVVKLTRSDCEKLRELAGGKQVIRFGKLNVIPAVDHDAWRAWREGTDELVKSAPVTRETAVATFMRYRELYQVGVSFNVSR